MAKYIPFKQVNLRKSFEASTQLNNSIAAEPAVCMLTEPFTAFGKVANVPANHKCVPCTTLVSRPRAAILIPKNMQFTHLEQLSNPDATVVLLRTDRGKILLASLYLDSKKPVVQPWLKKLVDYADAKQIPTLFALDSNAHSQLYGPDTNKRGEKFEEFIMQHHFKVENKGETPTFHAFRNGGETGTCIDVTLTRGMIPLTDWQVNDHVYNGSDHHTITWSLMISLPPPSIIRPWHQANWEIFREQVKAHSFDPPLNFTTQKLDKFLNQWYRVINLALDKACPTREAIPSPVEIAWFGKDQKRLLNRTKRKYAAYRREKSIHRRKAFNRARRIHHRSCRRAKHSSWREFVEKTPDVKSMAKLAKIAQRKENRTINTLLKDDNTLTEPGIETIRMLTDTHFPAAQEGTVEMIHYKKHKIRTSDIQRAFREWINPALVHKALHRFKPYKAAGPDELKPIVLQNLPDNAIQALTLIYQACVALKHTPKAWRKTKVIFLPKPGKPNYGIPKAYRPISLSNFALKGLERLGVWKSDKDLEDAPLCPQQHGFTKGKSTESAISQTVDYIEQQLFEKIHCLGLFLDISSAFDSISIDHIKASLLKHNLDPDFVEWYYSYLGRRHLMVELHGETMHLTTGTGFPQGGVCSAKFWLIAFDEAIRIINSHGIVGTGYADDCSALIGGDHPDNMIESMQTMLEQLVTWGQSCGLRFNPQKTEAVMFTRATRTFSREVRMDGAFVPYSDSVVYLGVTLDARLLWRKHVHKKIKKAEALLAKMAHLTAAYWGPRPKLLKWTWTGMVRPILSYAAMIWSHETESKEINEALRKLNRKAMNTIVRVPRSTPTRTMELVMDILPLHLHLMKEGYAAYQRLQTHIPLTWEGVFENREHAVSHLRFWQYFAQDLELQNHDPSSDDCHVPRPTLRFVLDTCSFVDMENSQYPLECNVYTDGSKKEGQVGSGVYIVRSQQMIHQLSYRLPDEASVFQAEVVAIREAARVLIPITDLTTIKFYVDSQAALRTFQKDIITSKTALQTIHMINSIKASQIIFVWTKAHIGIEGNEHADRLAKAGTTLEDMLDIPLPSTISGQLMEALRGRWDHEWTQHTECRQSKLFQSSQDTDKAKQVMEWPRLKLGRYIRAITGHNNLLYHIHNMYNFISPICRFCNEENEEFYHLAYTCPALWYERQQTNEMERHHFNDWTPEQIFDFTLYPRINEAFSRPLYWVEDERELLEVPDEHSQRPHRLRTLSSSSRSTSIESYPDVSTALSTSEDSEQDSDIEQP